MLFEIPAKEFFVKAGSAYGVDLDSMYPSFYFFGCFEFLQKNDLITATLGLEFTDVNYDTFTYLFKVIDEQLFMLTKIKYGI